VADIRELGKKVKAKYPGEYDDMDDVELGRRVRAKYPEYSDFTDVAPEAPVAPKGSDPTPGMFGQAVDVIRGAGSGLIHTGIGAYELARKIPGVGAVLPETSEFWKGAADAPESVGGTIGRFGEQAAEMMVPMSKVSTAAQALPAAGRIAAESAAAGGIAGVQSGGDPTAMATAAGTQGVLGAAGEALSRTGAAKAAAEMLKDSAAGQYAQALLRGGGKQGNKLKAEDKLVPELIDRGVKAWTLKGLGKKAEANVQAYGQAIDDAWRALPEGESVPVDDVLSSFGKLAESKHMLDDATGQMLPMGPEAERGISNIQALHRTISKFAEPVKIWDVENGVEKTMNVIPAVKMRKLRQYFDEVTKEAGGFEGKNLSDKSVAAAHKMAADGIREELAKFYPDIAKINKEFSFWKDLSQVVDDTIVRKTGHGPGLGATVMKGAAAAGGMASGGVGGAVVGAQTMGTLQRAMNSTAWRTVSAVQKDRLANAIAKGNRGEAERLIRMISATVTSATARNRTNQQPEEQE
jgi:hypothetical protein